LHIYIKGDYRQLNTLPIKKGDKDVFIQEEFIIGRSLKDLSEIVVYKENNEYPEIQNWIPASQMTKEQSRYIISECIDVRGVRAKELDYDERNNISGFLIDSGNVYFTDIYNNQLKEQNINRTYEDNDHIFLIEIKR